MPVTADAQTLPKMAEDLVAEGSDHADTCKAVVHRELEFRAVDWGSIRSWIRNADGMASFFGLSPEQQARITRSG